MDEEYFTVRDIAGRLKVHPETVKDWLKAGRLKGIAFGGRTGWRITDAQLREFLEAEAEATTRIRRPANRTAE